MVKKIRLSMSEYRISRLLGKQGFGQTGVYLKADARTAYAGVLKVLAVLRGAGVSEVALLTSQRLPAEPQGVAPTAGLQLLLTPGRGPVVALVSADGAAPFAAAH